MNELPAFDELRLTLLARQETAEPPAVPAQPDGAAVAAELAVGMPSGDPTDGETASAP